MTTQSYENKTKVKGPWGSEEETNLLLNLLKDETTSNEMASLRNRDAGKKEGFINSRCQQTYEPTAMVDDVIAFSRQKLSFLWQNFIQ
ncbi:unnamed protein product [Didymodactylos carnosus]|uniref:Uncharacterized protein n=1 Tax=Didymodactylos carnosus TaxID=1234261 RepID=A0A8S2DY37_9BILA|nr:unnamed protein product [Didymodactylos carnosus]CAF3829704.1 unnamed protein product [Didymodactylos carnosus]